MNAAITRTRRGIFAWIGRQYDVLRLKATLRWAESDREFLAQQAKTIPARLDALDKDLQALRVELALALRS